MLFDVQRQPGRASEYSWVPDSELQDIGASHTVVMSQLAGSMDTMMDRYAPATEEALKDMRANDPERYRHLAAQAGELLAAQGISFVAVVPDVVGNDHEAVAHEIQDGVQDIAAADTSIA